MVAVHLTHSVLHVWLHTFTCRVYSLRTRCVTAHLYRTHYVYALLPYITVRLPVTVTLLRLVCHLVILCTRLHVRCHAYTPFVYRRAPFCGYTTLLTTGLPAVYIRFAYGSGLPLHHVWLDCTTPPHGCSLRSTFATILIIHTTPCRTVLHTVWLFCYTAPFLLHAPAIAVPLDFTRSTFTATYGSWFCGCWLRFRFAHGSPLPALPPHYHVIAT